ncbi:MAG: hypothetical protein LBU00_06605 [Treponema sp.]|jgi:hypothetical protein|nr:hypothetical protein [Treponema sp.]
MKKISSVVVIFLCFIITVKADNDDESVLTARGYTKYSPEELFVLDVYRDTYEEIFNIDYRFQRTGRRTISLFIPNDYEYRLYYVLEKKELPNILVVVFIETEEGMVGFYKKNLSLTGVKVQAVIDDFEMIGFEKDELVFY